LGKWTVTENKRVAVFLFLINPPNSPQIFDFYVGNCLNGNGMDPELALFNSVEAAQKTSFRPSQ
jgi:hypothetical protein